MELQRKPVGQTAPRWDYADPPRGLDLAPAPKRGLDLAPAPPPTLDLAPAPTNTSSLAPYTGGVIDAEILPPSPKYAPASTGRSAGDVIDAEIIPPPTTPINRGFDDTRSGYPRTPPDMPTTSPSVGNQTRWGSAAANVAGAVAAGMLAGEGLGQAAGGVVGAAAGAVAGATLGSVAGPLGTAIGANIGAAIGGMIGADLGGRLDDLAPWGDKQQPGIPGYGGRTWTTDTLPPGGRYEVVFNSPGSANGEFAVQIPADSGFSTSLFTRSDGQKYWTIAVPSMNIAAGVIGLTGPEPKRITPLDGQPQPQPPAAAPDPVERPDFPSPNFTLAPDGYPVGMPNPDFYPSASPTPTANGNPATNPAAAPTASPTASGDPSPDPSPYPSPNPLSNQPSGYPTASPSLSPYPVGAPTASGSPSPAMGRGIPIFAPDIQCSDPCSHELANRNDANASKPNLVPVTVKVFKECKDGEAVYLEKTIQVVKGTEEFARLQFEQMAELQGQKCAALDPNLVLPEWWQVRKGQRPQLVVVYGELKGKKLTSSRWSMAIPHYNKPKGYRPKFPSYTRGNWEGILTLSDNSKVFVNASNQSECKKVLNSLKLYIPPELRRGATRKVGERNGVDYRNVTVVPVSAKFFSGGQRNATPDWVIKLR